MKNQLFYCNTEASIYETLKTILKTDVLQRKN